MPRAGKGVRRQRASERARSILEYQSLLVCQMRVPSGLISSFEALGTPSLLCLERFCEDHVRRFPPVYLFVFYRVNCCKLHTRHFFPGNGSNLHLMDGITPPLLLGVEVRLICECSCFIYGMWRRK